MKLKSAVVRPFRQDELLTLLVSPDDFRTLSPEEMLSAMSEEDRAMCAALHSREAIKLWHYVDDCLA